MANLIDDRRFEEAMLQIKEYVDKAIDDIWHDSGIGGGDPGYSPDWDGKLVPINGGGTGADNPSHAFANLLGYTVSLSANGGLKTSVDNIAFGQNSLAKNTSGVRNTSVGDNSMLSNTAGSDNVAVGTGALYLNTSGTGNTAVGAEALYNNVAESFNTAVGFQALKASSAYKNATGLGYDAQVTSHNQLQLGSGNVTTYVYGSVQSRSDERDKANIKDMEYPYRDFILGLRAVTFQWDMREDYRDGIQKLGDITHCGLHTRARRHGGFIAQEVKVLMDDLGFDFAGYQDHKLSGGDDVLSLGYEAFIAPMVATIQAQDKEIQSLRTEISDLRKHHDGRYDELLEIIEDLKSSIQNII